MTRSDIGSLTVDYALERAPDGEQERPAAFWNTLGLITLRVITFSATVRFVTGARIAIPAVPAEPVSFEMRS